jgi:hypothetical protein
LYFPQVYSGLAATVIALERKNKLMCKHRRCEVKREIRNFIKVLFDLNYVEFVVIDVFDKVCVLLIFFYLLQIFELINYSIINIILILYDVDLVEMNHWYAKYM